MPRKYIATFEKFLENLGSPVLHLCRLPQRIFPLTNIRKNKLSSFSEVLTGSESVVVAQYHHTTSYRREIHRSVPG